MIALQTTAEVLYTCYLSDMDEEKVRAFMEENDCSIEEAIKELFWDNKIDIYANSTESDFNTQTIDEVWEE